MVRKVKTTSGVRQRNKKTGSMLKHEPAKQKRTIVLDDPNLSAMSMLELELHGTAPMLQNPFSEKAKRQMEEKQAGKAKKKPAPRNPEQDFLNSMHVIGKLPKAVADLKKTRFGFPATGFKAAAVTAAKDSGVHMTDARRMFFVEADDGELVEISTKKPPSMDRRIGRIQQTVDMKYRAMFDDWGVKLRIRYNRRKVSAEQLVSWFIDAGISVGVGEMRPSGKNSSGSLGTWRLVTAEAHEAQLQEEVA